MHLRDTEMRLVARIRKSKVFSELEPSRGNARTRLVTAAMLFVSSSLGVGCGDSSTDPPDVATGACCASSGGCTIQSEGDCTTAGGTYSGNDSFCSPNPCPQPGPNQGGILIVHAFPELEWTEVGPCSADDAVSCDTLTTSVDGTGVFVVEILAAFPTTTNPSVSRATFGVTYGGGVTITDTQLCGDNQLTTANWPARSSGATVSWSTPQESHAISLARLHVTAAVDLETVLQIVLHPTEGQPSFYDGAAIPHVDPAVGLGLLGFSRDGTCPER